MKFLYVDGQTPIDGGEVSDLKLTHVVSIRELNIWESKNIQDAEVWASRLRNPVVILMRYSLQTRGILSL